MLCYIAMSPTIFNCWSICPLCSTATGQYVIVTHCCCDR